VMSHPYRNISRLSRTNITFIASFSSKAVNSSNSHYTFFIENNLGKKTHSHLIFPQFYLVPLNSSEYHTLADESINQALLSGIKSLISLTVLITLTHGVYSIFFLIYDGDNSDRLFEKQSEPSIYRKSAFYFFHNKIFQLP